MMSDDMAGVLVPLRKDAYWILMDGTCLATVFMVVRSPSKIVWLLMKPYCPLSLSKCLFKLLNIEWPWPIWYHTVLTSF